MTFDPVVSYDKDGQQGEEPQEAKILNNDEADEDKNKKKKLALYAGIAVITLMLLGILVAVIDVESKSSEEEFKCSD